MKQKLGPASLSRAQYKTVLSRAMDNPGSQSAGQPRQDLMQQAQNMGGGNPLDGGGMSPSGMPPGIPSMPSSSPIPPSSPLAPIAGMMTTAPSHQTMAEAKQMWDSIKGTMGEQLWNRIYDSNMGSKIAKTPEEFFIAETSRYALSPDKVANPDVRTFIESIVNSHTPTGTMHDVGQQQLASTLSSQGLDPSTAGA